MTLVDVVRHDPGSLALTTVSVDPFLDVETGATAHRMVSTVGAKLRADAGAAAALRSAFPDASDTGAPKPGTTRTTDRLESGPRGPPHWARWVLLPDRCGRLRLRHTPRCSPATDLAGRPPPGTTRLCMPPGRGTSRVSPDVPARVSKATVPPSAAGGRGTRPTDPQETSDVLPNASPGDENVIRVHGVSKAFGSLRTLNSVARLTPRKRY
ncbi:chorismate-binding protein [Streptomyces xantholiticus]|uniref:Chorismate-binding protein n=1 Tax=Streptomyces xantholiticus TaxID=68285 RepID=A0ABV1UUQ6_9ACTN